MFTKNEAGRASGVLAGFTGRWNPLTTIVYMLVKVNDKTIKVPIDHRQVRFIQKEYDIGGKIELQFYGGDWHVMSQIQPSCEAPTVDGVLPGQSPETLI